jgi:Na+/proline symporter
MPLETPEKPGEEQPPPKPRNNKPRNQLSLLAVLIVVVGLLGALAWDLNLQDENPKETEHNAVLGITIFTQAMIAFFGILNLEEAHATKVSPLTKGGMRSAIAGALVVTYIFLVIFHTMVRFATETAKGMPPITDSFVKSFTTIVGITICFYFASEAAIHWINASKRKE